MVRGRFAGVNTVRKRLRDGSVAVYHYHRATGQRLVGEPGSAAFVTAFAAAEQSRAQGADGRLSSLIRDYLQSPEFQLRAASTQTEYRRMLTRIEARFGDMPLLVLDDPRVRRHFLAWRAKVAKESGPREADNRLTILSTLLSWGRENGIIAANHVLGFKRLHKSDRSEKIWLYEHITPFMDAASVELQRALILALHTGQRQGDLLKLRWSNYEVGHISFRQGKTGRQVSIPCTKALKQMLDGLPRTSEFILTTTTGKPWTARYFKRRWAETSEKAGIVDLHFHDLRGTAVTMLAEAGATTPQIASITGHSLKTVTGILDHYLARTKTLANEAMALFEKAESTSFANRLQTRTSSERNDSAK